jgi:GNAT superfamily N-acetyltransferase
MSISPPIDTDDLDTLPDNTDLIETLNDKNKITTVLPRFLGTNDTGRFVTSFFVFLDKKITLYTRKRTQDEKSKLEKQASKTLSKEPTIIGELWNQTIIIETPDINTVEHLKQRSEYDSYWLTGYESDIPFNEYKQDPFDSTPTGLPDCNHTQATDPVKTPQLDLVVTLCEDCGIPLFLANDNGVVEARNTLSPEYIGIQHDDSPAKSTTTTPHGNLSNKEITLHVLSRFANVEQPHFDIYSRTNDHGFLLTIENSIAGYALWNEFEGHIALQQIYLLPPFRGENLGELLVSAWYNHIDADQYYAIAPNDTGTATLEKLGHIDDNIATPATILSSRDTLDPGAVNASRTDQTRRGNDPLDP